MINIGRTKILGVLRGFEPRFNIVALQLPNLVRNQIWMMHSPGVMEWDATWQILIIWTYKDAVKAHAKRTSQNGTCFTNIISVQKLGIILVIKWLIEMIPKLVERCFMSIRMIW